jgi:hypothetical protein
MMFHAASITAFFLQQTPQPQCVVRCVQAAQEPTLKWLLPTIVQTIISLASIAAGVLIAVWSFHATSNRGHKRWVLDQKRAEWKELLVGLSETFGEYMPPYMCDETAEKFIKDVGKIQRRTDRVTMPFIFIAQYLEDHKFHSRIEEFITLMLEQGKIMQGTLVYNHFPGQANSALQDAYLPIVRNYDEIVKLIKEMAEKDLSLNLANDKRK